MQAKDLETQECVILSFNRRGKAKGTETPGHGTADSRGSEGDLEGEGEAESFEDVMSKNFRNKERLASERATANKSVLKSYRIKS